VEGHHPGVAGAGLAAPRDPLIGLLLGDLGVPLAPAAADQGDPVEPVLRHLLDRLDPVHEGREVLELRPLV
jgi:hypothetical protein